MASLTASSCLGKAVGKHFRSEKLHCNCKRIRNQVDAAKRMGRFDEFPHWWDSIGKMGLVPISSQVEICLNASTTLSCIFSMYDKVIAKIIILYDYFSTVCLIQCYFRAMDVQGLKENQCLQWLTIDSRTLSNIPKLKSIVPYDFEVGEKNYSSKSERFKKLWFDYYCYLSLK